MITNKQRIFLQKLLSGEITKKDNPKKYSATMIRIQKQIDKNMANLVWLAENCPEILKDELAEMDNIDLERYRRFKALAYILVKLNPMTEIENVDLPDILVKLSRLNSKYLFKVLRKNKNDFH